jgi:hypothetical protein
MVAYCLLRKFAFAKKDCILEICTSIDKTFGNVYFGGLHEQSKYILKESYHIYPRGPATAFWGVRLPMSLGRSSERSSMRSGRTDLFAMLFSFVRLLSIRGSGCLS